MVPFCHFGNNFEQVKVSVLIEIDVHDLKKLSQIVQIQQIEKSTGVGHSRINRHTFDDIGKSHAPKQSRDDRAKKERPIPKRTPNLVLVTGSKFESDTAEDKSQQDE